MKKKYLIGIVLIIIILASGLYRCFFKKHKTPDEQQIKSICELSTLKCYYNNVVKITKDKGTGVTHVLEKDREMWIEYEGIAQIGIDMNEVSMKINKDTIEITMPSARIMDISINKEKINEDSYTISQDGFLNKNKITAEEQQYAIVGAQEEMRKSVEENKTLFEQAEKKAQDLIENYINKLGEISGKKYSIEWKKI